jgi:pyruvate/2-oxoglutarate dehydrogenase complex dihydrolipoamide acyltransferase (E2) component
MAVTNTNNVPHASVLARIFGAKDPQAPSVITAAPVKATPATETPQAQGARTRAKNAAWQAGVERQMSQLLEMVSALAALQATPQAPKATQAPQATFTYPQVAPQAPQVAPRPAPTPTPMPQAAPEKRNGFSEKNLALVSAALKAQACGCVVAYSASIWAKSGVSVRKQANGKNVKGLWYPNKAYPRGINGSITQMYCEHMVEGS